jgi:chromosome segregation ATPase
MLTTKNLEKLIELEDKLRTEYQSQLDAKTAEIDTLTKEKEQQKARLDTQLKEISTLSTSATANKHTEQLNRELTSRGENLQEEVTTLKKRVKSLQKDLAQERDELKALKQFDPKKMKKNLDANKKKLAEKTKSADALQKSLAKSKSECAEQKRAIEELEAKLAELETDLDDDENSEAEAA